MSLAPALVLREGDRGRLGRLPQMLPGSQPRAATSAEPQPDAVLAAAPPRHAATQVTICS
jgi:hypothetical protein